MKRRCFRLLSIIFMIILVSSSIYSAEDNPAIIALNPETTAITSVNQIIKVAVIAQNVTNLYGIDLDITYDPAVLTAVDQNGDPVSRMTLSTALSTPNKFVARNIVDNTAGNIKLAVSFLGKMPGITGNSELAYINFKAKKISATVVQIDKKMLVVINPNTGQVSETQSGSRNATLVVAGQPASGPEIVIQPPVNPLPSTTNPAPSIQEPVKIVTADVADVSIFTDIGSSWAKNEILKAASLNIISGDGKGKYNPQNNVTREEFAKIIFNAMGLKIEQSNSAIYADDKNISSWAKDYVSTVSNMGLIKGNNGSFYPQKGLSRYETAIILARALNLSEYEAGCDSFKDKNQIPDWAKGYVGAAYKIGLIKGMPDGTFSGSSIVSREQAASLIIRFLELK